MDFGTTQHELFRFLVGPRLTGRQKKPVSEVEVERTKENEYLDHWLLFSPRLSFITSLPSFLLLLLLFFTDDEMIRHI